MPHFGKQFLRFLPELGMGLAEHQGASNPEEVVLMAIAPEEVEWDSGLVVADLWEPFLAGLEEVSALGHLLSPLDPEMAPEGFQLMPFHSSKRKLLRLL